MELEYGIFSKDLTEQLKDSKIDLEKLKEFDIIKAFIFGCHFNGVITDKQTQKLFNRLTFLIQEEYDKAHKE